MRKALRLAGLLVFVYTLIASSSVPAVPVAAQQGPTDLLVNGDFEIWDWNAGSWPFQDGIPEVQAAPGWRAFWVDTPPSYATAPEYWKRPEFRDVKTAEFSYRVHSGLLAQKYFTFGGQHEAGLYQQVSGILPGTPLRFSVYMETWGCMSGRTDWNICPTGVLSNNPAPMHTRVGIDPTGGTNPWSSSIVWSPEIAAYDQWTLFQVDAVAQAATVTVFTYSYADWFDYVFRVHNDVYIDDASLIALDEVVAVPPESSATPTGTPDPSYPTETPLPTATPASTPTARPDGAIVYVVREGDSLSMIAAQHQLTVNQVMELNGLTDANVLWIGQELVVAEAVPTATPILPTPTPQLATPTLAPPTPTPTSVPPSPTAEATPTPTEAPGTATPVPAQEITSSGKGLPVFVVALILVVGLAIGFVAGFKLRK